MLERIFIFLPLLDSALGTRGKKRKVIFLVDFQLHGNILTYQSFPTCMVIVNSINLCLSLCRDLRCMALNLEVLFASTTIILLLLL